MKETEWVKFGDELPKLGKTIEVLKDNGELIGNIQGKICYNGSGIDFKSLDFIRESINIHRLSGWRYQSEKRPDFSKLQDGDLLVIEEENIRVGYFRKIEIEEEDDNDKSLYIDLSQCKDVDDGGAFIPLYKIKKITRINLEEKTFEEI